MSSGSKVEEQDAVVWVRRSAWERVTERDELVGRLSEGSRLPQYLMEVRGRKSRMVWLGRGSST